MDGFFYICKCSICLRSHRAKRQSVIHRIFIDFGPDKAKVQHRTVISGDCDPSLRPYIVERPHTDVIAKKTNRTVSPADENSCKISIHTEKSFCAERFVYQNKEFLIADVFSGQRRFCHFFTAVSFA